ncbi:MAG: VWA domain-containing protein [Planctomycetia bacterium]|nr:VWA domain-containing protein [Planctomycetia bacterium]
MTAENINDSQFNSDQFNSDQPAPRDREAADALLTAHALGQLEGDEQAVVERLLADPGRHEERRTVDEIGRLAAALRAGRTNNDLPRSPTLRRAVVAAIAANGGQAERGPLKSDVAVAPQPARSQFGRGLALAASLLVAVLVMVTAALVRPLELQPRVVREIAQRRSELRTEGVATALQERVVPDQSVLEQSAEKPSEAKAATAASNQLASEKRPATEQVDKSTNRLKGDAGGYAMPAAPADIAMAAAPAPGARRLAAERDARELEMSSVGGQRKQQDAQAGERYARFDENRPRTSSEQPLSTFSIDVDTASYANVRRFLTSGRLPPPDVVRIEEMVNYFRYDYPQPGGDKPFSVTLEAAECPWHSGRRLVRIGLEGRDIDRRERPAGNLVFLIDVSGSMAAANKLPLVKQALAMLVEELTENDSVAIVTYAGDAGVKLPATSGDQKGKILAVIESLSSGGSTHGSAGINLAYEQAAERFIPGGANRVILATDGDLNVGVTSDEALVDLIKQKAAGGTFLTVLGFGEGNLQDAKMEKIADNGNGVYAYIDGAREARKVLVEQLTGSTITIAKDVKIQVEFNPTRVASYRLLGYENRIMAAEDFRNDRKDAGEIGAGHSVTALYEIELVGNGGEGSAGVEPLKYQPPQPKPAPEAALVDGETSRELLTVKLRWKKPDGDASTLDEVPLVDRGGAFEQASADLRFAGAVAAFGMVLRNSEYKGEATLPLVAKIAAGALGPDRGGYRAEFLDLVRKAETLRDGGR